FQIPNDVAGGEPPSTDDNESQADLFAALQVRHAVGTHGALSYGVGYKNSHIRDFGDPTNDWAYGQAIAAAAGGAPTDCVNAFTIPNFSNMTCAYSLRSDRTAQDYTFNIDDALNSTIHDVRWGATYGVTNVTKHYNVTLQPGNFLAPLFAPSTPNAAYPVVDNAPNNADAESVYLQDSWHLGTAYELDYGLRSDSFQLRSTEFQRGYAMLSPRIKLTRILSQRSSVYAFYGRFFTPFSFENVSPTAAFALNLPLEPSPAAFDLKPQRDSVYEIGGNLPVGSANVGLRVMQKSATDLIDDTQVGATQLHQDINYQQGRVATQTAFYQLPLANQGSLYLTVNHTYAVNKGCETQLLAPCFGSPTDWTPADHEQRWGSTAGILLNNDRGGWFSMNGEYGSGLSSAACPPGTVGFCKYTPHTVFNVEQGIAMGPRTQLVVRIVNLLNDRFRITYLNAQGNHYYTPRSFSVGLEFGKGR
ncbi:MAG TPA: TonB-dependent receptor, partial [Candidatus Eremiobacteraceae bacterium]|nr:TonB-dependent receptor [Candidatus Eremiobacteraceae bacterium]